MTPLPEDRHDKPANLFRGFAFTATVLFFSWRQAAVPVPAGSVKTETSPAQELKDEIEARAAELTMYPQMYKVGRVPGTREMVVRANYVVV